MTSTAAALQLRGMRRTFSAAGHPPVEAVRGIDLTVPRGQIVALLGPNGAGKTTTFNMVLGLRAPSSGQVQVCGLTPRQAVAQGRVGAVLQTGGLLRDLTVRETATLIASTYAHPRPVDEVLERAGVLDLAGRRVGVCSGGEQQRLRFALALLPDPDILVLDEPTAAMDVQARHDFWDTMRADTAEGRTVLFATHYLEEADAFAERIVMIAGGRIVADGSTEQTRARAGGRAVSASLPSARVAGMVGRLRTRADVDAVQVAGTRVTVRGGDSDAMARTLLSDPTAHDLEVASDSLETAFMRLTADRAPEGDAS